MLFDIFDLGIFADIKAVDAVMLRIVVAAVIDTAARDDLDVGVVTDIKIVIDLFLESALGHHDGDMHALTDGVGLDEDIHAADARLADDLDILGGLSADGHAVGADVVRAREVIAVDVGNLFEQIGLYVVQIHDYTPSVTPWQFLTAAGVPISPGRISSLSPCFSISPLPSTMILSAMLRMRS